MLLIFADEQLIDNFANEEKNKEHIHGLETSKQKKPLGDAAPFNIVHPSGFCIEKLHHRRCLPIVPAQFAGRVLLRQIG